MSGFTESVVEEAALAWLEASGWKVAHGPDIAFDTAAAERRDYGEVLCAPFAGGANAAQSRLAVGRSRGRLPQATSPGRCRPRPT